MYAIEMDDTSRTASYGKIHRAGCRDLRDPIPLDRLTAESLYDATGWDDYTDAEVRALCAPCAKKIGE